MIEPSLCCWVSKGLAGHRTWYRCHIFTQQRNEHPMGRENVSLFNRALSLCQCGTMASLRRGSWQAVGRETGSRHLQLGKKPTLFPGVYTVTDANFQNKTVISLCSWQMPGARGRANCCFHATGLTLCSPESGKWGLSISTSITSRCLSHFTDVHQYRTWKRLK